MYTFAKVLAPKQFWLQQIPMLTASFVVAEVFYKFGSFTLECLAFLATWLLMDILANLLSSGLGRTLGRHKSGSGDN